MSTTPFPNRPRPDPHPKPDPIAHVVTVILAAQAGLAWVTIPDIAIDAVGTVGRVPDHVVDVGGAS